jgi:hypothetical protein
LNSPAGGMTKLRPMPNEVPVGPLIIEALFFSAFLYFFLQLLMIARYRGRWRAFALVPLLLMLPAGLHAGVLYASGDALWPLSVVVPSVAACVYLLLLGIVKSIVT